MTEFKITACRLCYSGNVKRMEVLGDNRLYFHCHACDYIFVHPQFLLSPKEERARYEFHQNGLEHVGYVSFLNQAIKPALDFLSHEMVGLDYGCGPNPTLSKILSQHGITCFDYDPIFGFNHSHALYDFIFATECIEHFHYPQREFSKITNLLKQRGYLVIMTAQWQELDKFTNWYYKNDPTHVGFFHRNTFLMLCEKFGYQLQYESENRVIILRKN